MSARSVAEWVGTTPDTQVPPRVRVRVFERDGGKCCECGRKIGPADQWICDHTVAIINGGANREINLRTICGWCDRNVKTPADVAIKSKTARVKTKHLGIAKRSSFPGARSSPWKAKIGGGWVRRDEA